MTDLLALLDQIEAELRLGRHDGYWVPDGNDATQTWYDAPDCSLCAALAACSELREALTVSVLLTREEADVTEKVVRKADACRMIETGVLNRALGLLPPAPAEIAKAEAALDEALAEYLAAGNPRAAVLSARPGEPE